MPDDTQQNCVLEVCCGGVGSKQIQALTEWLQANAFLNRNQALTTATALAGAYDFAPKGTLYDFKQAIRKLALGPPYTG